MTSWTTLDDDATFSVETGHWKFLSPVTTDRGIDFNFPVSQYGMYVSSETSNAPKVLTSTISTP